MMDIIGLILLVFIIALFCGGISFSMDINGKKFDFTGSASFVDKDKKK